MKKLKIAILSFGSKPIPSPSDKIFAPGIIISAISDGLVERGHEVDLFAPSDSRTKANLISYGSSVYSNYKELNNKNQMSFNDLIAEDELNMYSQSINVIKKGNYDIINAHNYRRLMYFSDFLDQPIIYTYHGNPLEDIINDIDKRRAKRFYKNNLFIAISKQQKEIGKKYFNFIDVIPHGVDIVKYKFSNNYEEKLLFLGRIIERKGPDIAIKAAKNTNMPLIIVGQESADKQNRIYFERKVEPFLKSPNQFIGHVSFDQVNQYYKRAKALLVPIKWEEPFGLVMIEAMACGCPVIAFKIGSAPEIIKDGETGYLVDMEDGVQGFTNAIKKLNSLSPNEYSHMRKKCRERVEQCYTYEKMIDRYEELFEKVAK